MENHYQIESFKNTEICAVGFNDKNPSEKSTGLFLAADYNNNIYECIINLDKKSNDEYRKKNKKKLLTKLVFKDWDTEEDEEYSEPKTVNYEHIYGIRFVKTTKLSNEIGIKEKRIYDLIKLSYNKV